MIKARAVDGTIILGLSHRNLALLRVGRPIRVDCKEMLLTGAPPELVIFSGRDEEAMLKSMKDSGLLCDDAPIHDMTKTGRQG